MENMARSVQEANWHEAKPSAIIIFSWDHSLNAIFSICGTDLMQVHTRECKSSEHSHTRVEYFPNARASCEGAASRVSTRTFVKLLQKTHSHLRAKFLCIILWVTLVVKVVLGQGFIGFWIVMYIGHCQTYLLMCALARVKKRVWQG